MTPYGLENGDALIFVSDKTMPVAYLHDGYVPGKGFSRHRADVKNNGTVALVIYSEFAKQLPTYDPGVVGVFLSDGRVCFGTQSMFATPSWKLL